MNFYASDIYKDLNTITIAGHEFTGLEYVGDTAPAALTNSVVAGVSPAGATVIGSGSVSGVKDAAMDLSTATVAGVTITGATGYFENVSFNGSNAGVNGAALWIEGSAILDSVSITNNRGAGLGGAIYKKTQSITVIRDSWLAGNNGTQYGGVLFVNNGPVNISGSTFYSNTGKYGGAIAVDNGTGANGTFTDSLFDRNIATDMGGAISIMNVTSISGTTFSGNSATNKGGALIARQNVATVTGSTFTGNTASHGGAVYVGYSTSGTGDITITNSVIDANYASYGAAVFAVRGVARFNGSTVSNNVASTQGGAFYVEPAGAITATNTLFGSNRGGGYGGAGVIKSNVEGSGTENSFTGSTFSGNSANNGGALVADENGVVTISNTTFTGNVASTSGGAIHVGSGSTAGYVTVQNHSVISGNRATSHGGAIYVLKGNFTVNDSLVADNFSGSYGGGVFVSGGTIDVSGATFSGNTATAMGGGVHVDNSGTGTIVNALFAGNTSLASDNSGGGLSVMGRATVTGSTFTGNYGARGGAIAARLGSTVISGGSFVVCLLVFMGAETSSLVAYIPIVLGTAAIGSVIVQLLYLPLKKVLNR